MAILATTCGGGAVNLSSDVDGLAHASLPFLATATQGIGGMASILPDSLLPVDAGLHSEVESPPVVLASVFPSSIVGVVA